jgi:hypothetical protein
MRISSARIWGMVAVGYLVAAMGVAAQEDLTVTPRVFSRYGDRVVRIQVVESASAAKVGVGSGFFIGDRGYLVTNYHVIADMVHHPERHRAELGDGTTADTATILAIDVVHDLAILQVAERRRPSFALGPAPVNQGDRLFALGHPNDLGLSIVEGTYNGLLKHTLYPKLHFTGSLNPGMSGGPTITFDGRVVGVNVSTAGNAVSFLVPVDRVNALLAAIDRPGHARADRLLDDVARQITAYQDVYLDSLLTAASKTVDLGPYRVVTEPAAFFRCWGDAPRVPDLPYERAQHRCSTDDEVYVAAGQRSGVVELTHELITTSALGPSRFFSLYSGFYQRDDTPFGREEHVTSWRCGTRNVRTHALPLRATLCLRAYRKLEGLYDGVVKVAVLGRRDSGLVSTLTLTGATFANIQRLTARYLGRFTWP